MDWGDDIDRGRPKCWEEDQCQFVHKHCVKDWDRSRSFAAKWWPLTAGGTARSPLCGKIVAVYRGNRVKRILTLRGQNAGLCNSVADISCN